MYKNSYFKKVFFFVDPVRSITFRLYLAKKNIWTSALQIEAICNEFKTWTSHVNRLFGNKTLITTELRSMRHHSMKSMKGETIVHASVFLVANKDSITIKAFLDAYGAK